MNVIEKSSKSYSIDNAEVYERSVDGTPFAVRIEPSADYGLRHVEEGSSVYTKGYMLIPVNKADEIIQNLSTVRISDFPEPEPVEDEEERVDEGEEISDSEALIELLEVIDNET